MPISGRFYPSEELQKLLGIGKQGISDLARRGQLIAIRPGLYYAESAELLLQRRGIEPLTLSVVSWDWPEGVTWAEQQRLYQAAMAVEDDEE